MNTKKFKGRDIDWFMIWEVALHRGEEDTAVEGLYAGGSKKQWEMRDWTGSVAWLKPRAHPQGPASSSEALSPNAPQPSHTMPPAGAQVFKHVSL